ncbi:MAG: ABC transporter permease [Saprospiraceae bacterium]|nr:ABC transporter permease [Saprospiraceae bacterium]
MLHNYLVLALKNLLKRRFVASINLLGLSMGIAVCVLIGLFIRHEKAYDRFHAKSERICRLNTTMKYPGASESTMPYSSYPMGPFLAETFGKEIEAFCRVVPIDQDFILQNGEHQATIRQVFAADSTFFQLFDFKFLQGEPATALSQPQSIVLTRKTAENIFQTAEALGKTLSKTYVSPYSQEDTTEHFTVSAVLENVPTQSHLQFDALLSGTKKPFWAFWNPELVRDWHVLATMTYLLLRSEQTDRAALEQQIPLALRSRMQGSEQVAHQLQPLLDIHLGSKGVSTDQISNFASLDGQYLRIFGFIGLFVLLIATVNYSNLSTILAGRRAKEIAVRKVIGASRRAVVSQFLVESVLTTGLALLLAAGLMVFARPFLQHIDYPITALEHLSNPAFLIMGITGLLMIGVLAGAYPAFFIGKTGPAHVLCGQKLTLKSKQKLIPILVTGQFAIAVALIAATVVCYRQMQFLQNADLGYSNEQIVTLDLGMSNMMKGQVLKEKLEKVPGVIGITISDQVMGKGFIQNGVRYIQDGKMEHIAIPCLAADNQFVNLYGMELVAGSGFSHDGIERGSEYLINEALARRIGWGENAVGQQISIAWQQEYGTVVGVLKDFHFNSLRHKIEPVCVRASNFANSISLKVDTKNLPHTLSEAATVWKSVVTDKPFEYKWADEQFAQVYRSETRFSRLTGLGAGLAVFIACLGLLGLVTFTAEQRVKEIGIRKVLGASVASITSLLTRDYLKLVVASFVIAFPLTYFLMEQWLQDFAYRIHIEGWMFAVAGFAAILVALLTVGFQSVRAALANPVRSLRSE